MIDEKFIYEIVRKIHNKGYECFTSEAQIRDLFAIEIGLMNPHYIVMPEYTQDVPAGWRCSEKLVHFDLLIDDKEAKEKTLIEFKYKTSKGEFDTKNGMHIKLKDNSDSTNGRYAIWRDIYRIEAFSNLKHIDKGFIVFVTNNSSYFSKPRTGTLAEEFSITPELHIAANKKWNIGGHSMGSISSEYRKDAIPLIISNDYRFIYSQYSTLKDISGKVHQFNLLVVPIYSNDYYEKLKKQVNRMGKKNFVKYYDLLKSGDSSKTKAIMIDDTLSKTSVDTILTCARNVFKEKKNIEVLRNIVDSDKVEASLRIQAEEILKKELYMK